jgi:serine/threonine protein kinase
VVDAPESRGRRLAKALASPTGVVVIVPLLVVAAGAGVLLLGLAATRDTSDSMAKSQLATQADDVWHDLAFALDQAEPMLVRMRALADPALAIADVAPRLHDLHVGRAGVTNISIGFPSGNLRGTYMEGREVRVQESMVGASATTRTNFAIDGRTTRTLDSKQTDYDVRKRPHYEVAIEKKTRTWMPPRLFFTSKTTGITCVEPIFADGALVAVLTVDFDVGALSDLIVRAPMSGARSVFFTRDGTILAYPSVAPPEVAVKENRLLSYADYGDPALTALVAAIGTHAIAQQEFLTVAGGDKTYLASVAPLAGARAGVPAPLDWYLATLVPESSLLGATRRLQTQSLLASGGALALAVAIAVLFAWNLSRMRRLIGAARERARDAEERATDLGSYRLVEKLGAGGMGEVWRAEHRLLARQAAIKLVRSESLQDPVRAVKLRERFRREAQTLATMRSRHTIALYDYGVADDGTFFYVMELLDGLDLDKYIREYGTMPAARVIHVLAQACQSLAEAHDAGLLHRDIKPGNLFLTRAADEVDIIKLLDFGIVRSFAERDVDPSEAVTLPTVEERMTRAHRLTKTGAIIGTTGYIAPEQLDGKDTDGRSDLYAIGCVAWWLLSASEVFPRATDEMETLRAHVEDPLPDLRARVRGWMPIELEELVRACLSKSADDRPTNARVLASKLRSIPIPDEHVWTDAKAQAWWYMHRAAPSAPVESATEKRLLVSDREKKPRTT